MRDSIYNVFRTALKEFLVLQGEYFLESELDDLTNKVLEKSLVSQECEGFCLQTNKALVEPNLADLRVERELPHLLVFREVNHFGSNKELLSEREFTLHKVRNIDSAEEILLN